MKKVMILILVLLVIGTILLESNTNKNPVKSTVKDKEIKVLVDDKMINSIINEISQKPKTADIIFNNKEQKDGYKLTDSLKSSIYSYDAYFYNSKIESFSKEIIDSAGDLKLGEVCVTRGGKEIKSQEDIPCYYLDGDNLKIAVLNIKNAVQDLDPKNRDIYEKNYNTYIKLINFYLSKGKEVGKELKNYIFLCADDRYKVFTDYYNLESINLKDYQVSHKQGVFVYTDEKELKNNEMLIKIYNLKTMKLSLPCDDGIIYSFEKNLKYFRFLHGDIAL